MADGVVQRVGHQLQARQAFTPRGADLMANVLLIHPHHNWLSNNWGLSHRDAKCPLREISFSGRRHSQIGNDAFWEIAFWGE